MLRERNPVYKVFIFYFRSAARGSLQTIESSLEKAQLENEIVKLDKLLEITDKEVTKLSILAQEVLRFHDFYQTVHSWL